MEKKNSCLILIFFFCLACNALFGQSIKMLVKKGSAMISGQKLEEGTVTELKGSKEVEVRPSSLVFVYHDGHVFELQAGKSYSMASIQEGLKNKTSYSAAFIKVISNQDYSLKKKSGITARGSKANQIQDVWAYAPADSSILLEDILKISAGTSDCTFMGPIVFSGGAYADTIATRVGDFQYEIKVPPPGRYSWQYKMRCGDKIRTYNNMFTVPAEAEKKNLLKSFREFQNSLGNFSLEMRAQLLEEYAFQNRIFLNLK